MQGCVTVCVTGCVIGCAAVCDTVCVTGCVRACESEQLCKAVKLCVVCACLLERARSEDEEAGVNQ